MFSGTFTPHDDCRSIFDVSRNDMEGSITEGTVTGNQIQFKHGSCLYRGTLRNSTATQMNGTIFCPFSPASQDLRQVGSWETAR
jgi:hypothetical protein